MRHRSPKLSAGLMLGLLLGAAACAQTPDKSGDHEVALRLINGGAESLRCSIVFGHWVYRDLGEWLPGQVRDIAMIQSAKNGALYINRFDGERQMMIENLVCGRMENWHGSQGQVDLAPVRSTRVTAVAARCAAAQSAGRVICEVTEIAH